MRPAGEVREQLLKAAETLSTPERSPTLREMALHAQVGFDAARATVQNMCRAGVLAAVRTRRVDYRNRPVTEYCKRPLQASQAGVKCVLREAFSGWSTPIV